MSTPKIVAETVVARAEDLVFRDLDGETVMLCVRTGKYYGLDPVGSRVWALIEKPRRVYDVCTTLLDEFEVDRETCERDVLAFLNKLGADDLVKVTDGVAP